MVLHGRGLDNRVYYTLAPQGEYYNYSGCGNTFNCNHPVARKFIVDCLRFWVTEYHIDGFRFDLASILTRANSAWQQGTQASLLPRSLALSQSPHNWHFEPLAPFLASISFLPRQQTLGTLADSPCSLDRKAPWCHRLLATGGAGAP